jgi:hypothetical protein
VPNRLTKPSGGARAERGRRACRAGEDRGRGAAGCPPCQALCEPEAIVNTLIARFKLGEKEREEVARRYHELETGQLDARRADPALLNVLASLLRAQVACILAWSRDR